MVDEDVYFSIITVNYNGERFLVNFLNSLVSQTFKKFKLCFVDNGSIDNSIKVVNDYKDLIDIEIIELDKNYGFARANNIGIDKIMNDKSEFIITLNNDIELERDCLEKLNLRIEELKTDYDVFQILMINFFDRNIIDAAGIKFSKHYFTKQIGYKQDIKTINELDLDISGVCAGAAVYSKKSLLAVKEEQTGYFDSRFFAYYEDVDLGLRLLKRGFKSALIKEAIVFHVHSGTGNQESSFKSYYISRNLCFYLRKNLTEKEYNNIKFYYIMRFTKIITSCIVKGRFGLIKPTFKGYFDYKKNIKSLIPLKK